jgi:hypothetical protein
MYHESLPTRNAANVHLLGAVHLRVAGAGARGRGDLEGRSCGERRCVEVGGFEGERVGGWGCWDRVKWRRERDGEVERRVAVEGRTP